jgi:pilus assembly protein TadC
MVWLILESMNDNGTLIILLPIAIACLGGAVPHYFERKRRRSIELAMPEILEAISSAIGAGLGVEQALTDVAENRKDITGKLLSHAIKRSKAASFDASLAKFALETRSKMAQRIINLLSTSLEQNAPMQDVTFRMSMEYERLNSLMNDRESKIFGQAFTMLILMGLMLPAIAGFIVGVFAGPPKGFPVDNVLDSVELFTAAASGVTVAISGRMLGRLRSYLWTMPAWMLISTSLFHLVYMALGSSFG